MQRDPYRYINSDSDRGLFNMQLQLENQDYIAKQYKYIEHIWNWHNQKRKKMHVGDLY